MNDTKRKVTRYATLKDWRTAHDLSQSEAAAVLGYSLPGYHKLEHGQRHPHGAQLRRVLKITGVPLEVLTGVA